MLVGGQAKVSFSSFMTFRWIKYAVLTRCSRRKHAEPQRRRAHTVSRNSHKQSVRGGLRSTFSCQSATILVAGLLRYVVFFGVNRLFIVFVCFPDCQEGSAVIFGVTRFHIFHKFQLLAPVNTATLTCIPVCIGAGRVRHTSVTAAALAASPSARCDRGGGGSGLVHQSLVGAASAYLYLADDCRLLSDVGRRPLRPNSNDVWKLLLPRTHNNLDCGTTFRRDWTTEAGTDLRLLQTISEISFIWRPKRLLTIESRRYTNKLIYLSICNGCGYVLCICICVWSIREQRISVDLLRKRELKWVEMLENWEKWMSKRFRKVSCHS